MTAFHSQIRQAVLPLAFIAAVYLGVRLWLNLGDISLAHCPADLVWYGLASGDKKCSWPLPVYLAKDMGGAAVTAALPVLLCAAVVPPADRKAAACIAAMAICALALLYLLGGSHHLRPASLLVGVGVASALSSWLATWCVARTARPR
jgi:hypothetical protein